MSKTVAECLTNLKVPMELLLSCPTVTEEYQLIKRHYFRLILSCHPDKGGDPAIFRIVQDSFEVIRLLFENKIDTFKDTKRNGSFKQAKTMPSYEHFAAAAEEPFPAYRVELAKSNRSSCNQKGSAKKCLDKIIAKHEIRVGWIDPMAGSYSRWVHLNCWRVPSSIWLGLPDPETTSDYQLFANSILRMNQVLFCGFDELGDTAQQMLIGYVMNKSNWARRAKPRPKKMQQSIADVSTMDQKLTNSAEEYQLDQLKSTALEKSKERFIIPRPGVSGAIPDCLVGKRIVVTGIFPEVGGGVGLNLGKDKVKKLIAAFGGTVTSSISGKTNMLVVGKQPGFSKVSKARERDLELLSLSDLKSMIEGKEDRKPMIIDTFSSGYRGNSLALMASAEELAIASGRQAAPLKIKDNGKRNANENVRNKPIKKQKARNRLEKQENSGTNTKITKKSGKENSKLKGEGNLVRSSRITRNRALAISYVESDTEY